MLGTLAQIQHLWRFEALRRVPILAQLTPAQRSSLCSAFIQEAASVGEDIIKQVTIVKSDAQHLIARYLFGVGRERREIGFTSWNPASLAFSRTAGTNH